MEKEVRFKHHKTVRWKENLEEIRFVVVEEFRVNSNMEIIARSEAWHNSRNAYSRKKEIVVVGEEVKRASPGS